MASKYFSIVVAACNSRGIGNKGKLPWRLKGDMTFFRHLTSTTTDPGKQNAVIMGRKTWQSIPSKFRPLEKRMNIVISSSMGPEDGIHIVSSFTEALSIVNSFGDNIEQIFIIGGSSIYEMALESPLCSRIYLTRVFMDAECDVFLPNFNNNKFKQVEDPNVNSQVQDEDGISYQIQVYQQLSKLREFKVSVAMVEKSRGFASLNKLPWPCIKEDYIFYTDNISRVSVPGNFNMVIIGRKTWDATPQHEKTLPNTKTIVITRDTSYSSQPGVLCVCLTLTEALQLSVQAEHVWLLGGQDLWQEGMLMPECSELYVTFVKKDFPSDRFFPEFQHLFYIDWSKTLDNTESEIPIEFCLYKRNSVENAFLPEKNLANPQK